LALTSDLPQRGHLTEMLIIIASKPGKSEARVQKSETGVYPKLKTDFWPQLNILPVIYYQIIRRKMPPARNVHGIPNT
jgi:hypothetical protein